MVAGMVRVVVTMVALLAPLASSLMVTMQPNGSFPSAPSYLQVKKYFICLKNKVFLLHFYKNLFIYFPLP